MLRPSCVDQELRAAAAAREALTRESLVLLTTALRSNLAELLEQPGRLSTTQPVLITVMTLLAAGLFVILLVSNRRMRNILPKPETVPLPVEESSDPTA